MPAQRRRSRFVVALTAAALLVSVLPTAVAEAAKPARERPQPQAHSDSDAATAKIHPKLRRAMAQAKPATQLQFVARIVAGTSLDPYATRWFARPWVDPTGMTVAVGTAKKAGLAKIAGLAGVASVQLPESVVPRPKPIPSERPEPRRAPPRIITNGHGGPAPAGWFHTGSAIHGSQDAWAKGYTGDGVRYMSNDSGADYCHPDLFGTWAYIDDPASPYDGLPEMFDSYSSFITAQDFYLGTTFVRDGAADYADTSTEVAFSPNQPGVRQALFKPLGAKNKKTFKLPSTSKSGVYHIGSHPDNSLASVADVISKAFFKGAAKAQAGERAGVLVVDEQTSGVYDTVYVDLNYDYDFRNDAPARLSRDFSSREAACLDYDQDGLNDISGGLVYFVSTGRLRSRRRTGCGGSRAPSTATATSSRSTSRTSSRAATTAWGRHRSPPARASSPGTSSSGPTGRRWPAVAASWSDPARTSDRPRTATSTSRRSSRTRSSSRASGTTAPRARATTSKSSATRGRSRTSTTTASTA